VPGADYSIMPRDDPVLRLILEQDLDDNVDDLIKRLRLLGRHRFADQLEAETLARAGVTFREYAARLAPAPPAGWFNRLRHRLGLDHEPGAIW
jgi:hypothetical protein